MRLAHALAPAAVLAGALAIGSAGAADLPKSMAWTAYDVGSAGYNQAVAIGKAFKEKYGVDLRVLPGKNDISRMIPLRERKVQFSANGVGTYFGQEGVLDFEKADWGPQELRVVLSAKGAANLMVGVAGDAGVKSLKDLKGKRVAWVKGSPALNHNVTAFLAFGGLTWNDVQKVEFSGFGPSWDGMIANQVDAAFAITNSGKAVQAASSPRGLVWPPTPHDDEAGWKRMKAVAPYMTKNVGTAGAAMSKDAPQQGQAYPYPILTVYADAGSDLVYAVTKAMVDAFDAYKDGAPGAAGWALQAQSLDWAVPYHDGAIKLFKEKGLWSDALQKHNDALVARQKVLVKAWADFKKGAPSDEAKFADDWRKARVAALKAAGMDPVFD